MNENPAGNSRTKPAREGLSPGQNGLKTIAAELPHGHDPLKGKWNDSLGRHCLWTNGNLGELLHDVMTPSTWAIFKTVLVDEIEKVSLEPWVGNICGRLYLNISLVRSMAAKFGLGRKRMAMLTEEVFGRIPGDLKVPLLPMSRRRLLQNFIPLAFKTQLRMVFYKKRFPRFISEALQQFACIQGKIRSAPDKRVLRELWETEVFPYLAECSYMYQAVAKLDGGAWMGIRLKLKEELGETDTNIILTGGSTGTDHLASLGPVVGLSRLARGETDCETFAREFGHRGPHELELSFPRPAEKQGWNERLTTALREIESDGIELLERQHQARQEAWARIKQKYPHRVTRFKRLAARWEEMERNREAARSEWVRAFWLIRSYMLKAGELTGSGEDIFFHYLDEILALLEGVNSTEQYIQERRRVYESYRELPPYPALILGPFDPYGWAGDPNRRSDLYDATKYDDSKAPPVQRSEISGFPGSPGVIQGRVRVILDVEQQERLQSGEILVATATNVGWTPIFPRAAAVVTDVGAPLSHAAIVARELGIPAVVGCGNATTLLKTGDLVQVSGGQGLVEILEPAGEAGQKT